MTRPAPQPWSGPIPAATCLPSTPENVLWGRLPCEQDSPVRTVAPGTGVAVPGSERPRSVPPGRHGGTVDLSLLTAGSTLYSRCRATARWV